MSAAARGRGAFVAWPSVYVSAALVVFAAISFVVALCGTLSKSIRSAPGSSRAGADDAGR